MKAERKSGMQNAAVMTMDDSGIVQLYWDRDEKAISESDRKYGRMLNSLSFSLLSSREDAEECVNDTYIDAWNSMPDARPTYLGAFLSKITRRISIDRYREAHREKRGGIDNICDELTECIPDSNTPYSEYRNGILKEAIERFLNSCDREKRAIFILRYFYSKSCEEIAERLSISVSKTKTTLHRLRNELKKKLEEQGLYDE